jgi:hypothetical protein
MKYSILVSLLLALAFTPGFSEARVGGGRSFSGSRGSRGFSSPPSRGPVSPSYPARPYNTPGQGYSNGGNSLLRGMAGGVAGGFLGSMLMRGLGGGGGGGYGYGGGGGIGLIEILLFGLLAFFGYKWYTRRRMTLADGPTAFSGVAPDYATPSWQTSDANFRSDNSEVVIEQSTQDNFIDSFFKIQAAWMHRDLTPVRSLLTPEMSAILEEDVTKCKTLHQINKLENITVRQSEVIDSWAENNLEFATLRINANDYTVDENTNAIVAGSQTMPIKFEENWTFVHDKDKNKNSNEWQLSAIENRS